MNYPKEILVKDYFDIHEFYSNIYGNNRTIILMQVGSFYECNVRLFRTTTDTFILIKNDPDSVYHNLIEFTDSKISFNRQHDINNIILSENDNEKRLAWLKEQEKIHESDFEKCKEWQHVIAQVSKDDDKFNTVIDPNGQMQHVYSRNGLVYLPICTTLYQVNLIQSENCYLHQPAWYLTENGQNRTGFLTQNNYIR